MTAARPTGLPEDSAAIHRLMDEIVQMHNELYHPGQDCPSEDEDGACSIRSGKQAVLLWTDHGLDRTGFGDA